MNKKFEQRWAYLAGAHKQPPPLGFDEVVTVPQDVQPLDVIIRHMMQGIAPMSTGGVYGDDNPDIFKMDAVELQEYRQEVADDIENMKQQFETASRQLKKKQDEERTAKRVSSKENAPPGAGQSPPLGEDNATE